MSESISTSLPRSGPSSAEAFAGADDIARAWRDGLAPDPLLTVPEWSEKHRMLAARASAEPGRYRIARTPYMRAIMDALSPADPCRRVVFMKAAQVGATEGANCFIGFVIHQAPGPMLAVQPTVELAKRNSRQRIDPLIEESAALRSLVRPARSRDSGNTMLSKEFAGGILIMIGANSAVGLRSIPARYILLDEVDAYPASADEEGDPVTLAEARSLTFAHRRKVLLISTPTVKGFSHIEREYEASDQRRYFVPCPHCGYAQVLVFERLKWDTGKPETAAYHCAACETPIAEHYKTAMLAAGVWRATGTAADTSTIGFHLSALYSPVGWLSWEAVARAWIAAQGSDEAIRAFRNTILGETWVESGEAPDWQRLYDRRERWPAGTVPAGGLFLTAGADVQKDRIEVDVWAWGRGLESWLIDHVVIEGALGAVAGEHDDGLAAVKVRRLAFEDVAEISGLRVSVHGSDLLCRGGPDGRRPHHRIVVKVWGTAGASTGEHMALHLGVLTGLERQQLAAHGIGRNPLGEHLRRALGHAGEGAELGDEPGLGRALAARFLTDRIKVDHLGGVRRGCRRFRGGWRVGRGQRRPRVLRGRCRRRFAFGLHGVGIVVHDVFLSVAWLVGCRARQDGRRGDDRSRFGEGYGE